MSERLQKILARTGIGSRRACETYIRDGRVTVNGRAATIGMKADADVDVIRVDGERIDAREKPVYIAVYKPRGVLSSHRSQGGNSTIFDLVKIPQRTFIVGRLDLDSEGLILLTNDGELANLLLHPRYEHEKEYRVLLDRTPDDGQLSALAHGVSLPEGVKSLPARVWREDSSTNTSWVHIVLRQGRKRQIREMMRTLGLEVRRLIRVRIGPIQMGDLRPGTWRFLSKSEQKMLQRLLRDKQPSTRRTRSPGRSDVGRKNRQAGE
ncbi:MAG: pseudouridine synthase [Anaerolineales bacterium]|jgi:23S rRNA pseudouridine2605 synthase